QLHDKEVCFTRLFESVECRDVGMIERGQDFGFTFESRDPFRIFCERLCKYLHGHASPQSRVLRLIHFPHSTSTQADFDFVVSEFVTDHFCGYLRRVRRNTSIFRQSGKMGLASFPPPGTRPVILFTTRMSWSCKNSDSSRTRPKVSRRGYTEKH